MTGILDRQLVDFHRLLIAKFQKGNVDSSDVERWEQISRALSGLASRGLLQQSTANVAQIVVNNVNAIAQSTQLMDQALRSELEQLTEGLENLVIRCPDKLRCTAVTRSKRQWPVSPSPSASSLSDPSSPRSHASRSSSPVIAAPSPRDPSDHLRLWFLENLSNPYPTAIEKSIIAQQSGMQRNKIDSDMTNWRRRAGWTEIKDKWCKKDKELMKDLIEGYEMGTERREEVIEAIERMKGYLMKEKENSVGSWIENLKSTKDADHEKRKRARTSSSRSKDDKGKRSSRFMTPPPSAKPSTTSSMSSTTPFAQRTTSISSLGSSSTSPSVSLAPSFDFKPYHYSPSTAPSIIASSPETIILGSKRSNESLSFEETPHTRQKVELSPAKDIDAQWVPHFPLPTETAHHSEIAMQPQITGWTPGYDDVVYAPPHPFGSFEWSSAGPMPEYLPHMDVLVEQGQMGGGYTIPGKHDFAFHMPMSDMRVVGEYGL